VSDLGGTAPGRREMPEARPPGRATFKAREANCNGSYRHAWPAVQAWRGLQAGRRWLRIGLLAALLMAATVAAWTVWWPPK